MRFVFDLDGTICFRGKPVSEALLQCFERLEQNGHGVFFASARPIRDMLPVLAPRFHHHTLIGGNGVLISKNGKISVQRAFTEQQLADLLALIDSQQATYLIDGDWDYAYTGSGHHPILNHLDVHQLAQRRSIEELDSIVKILLLSMVDYDGMVQALQSMDIVVRQHTQEHIIDISPKHIDKWQTLHRLGIEDQGYIAFGNDANDLTMFQHALHSVMIGHHPQLAELATESIEMDADCEQAIIQRLNELSEKYITVI
ncbi:hydrolase [Pullulanibacillus camelliae]|uniref:Hydrolase n=1 Tax=Pullulanibacillus camelliae TaxID=1707096 RepID=A0A8J2YIQ5_9BACL|nr:HAD family hydrolase [Pullulanibacillus camelliae]GGE45275.1 hydrolase [Pullulanibacillus camelliae]